MDHPHKESNTSIVVEDAWTPALQQANDDSLMERFCKLRSKNGTSDNRLRIANEVRMWLRVITVAELVDADGACISPEKLDRRWQNDSTLLWPNSPKPSEKMFKIFLLYVRKSLCSNVTRHVRSERLTLDRRLGAWHQVHRHSKNE